MLLGDIDVRHIHGDRRLHPIAQLLDVPMSTVIRACSENPPPR